MIAKKKTHSSASQRSKPNRRMITFWRMIRYGTDSFMRNSWLSVAATAVMTITLLIILISFLTQNILSDTIKSLQDKVGMSIYLIPSTSDEAGAKLVSEVNELSTVTSAKYISSTEARMQVARDNISNQKFQDAIGLAVNKTPATLRVTVKDINDTRQLEDFVKENSMVKKYLNPDHLPSFAGERRSSIKKIGSWVSFAQKIGVAAGAIFVVISSLIIFNTIRMAIFNRKEEIQMMKLIGADKSFIRGPFLVEAVIYGIIAAFLATALGAWLVYAVSKTLINYQINAQPTVNMMFSYIPIVVLVMITIGALIGTVSSLLATHRYLKL